MTLLTRSEIVDEIAKNTETDRSTVSVVVKEFLAKIRMSMEAEVPVHIKSFGKFYYRYIPMKDDPGKVYRIPQFAFEGNFASCLKAVVDDLGIDSSKPGFNYKKNISTISKIQELRRRARFAGQKSMLASLDSSEHEGVKSELGKRVEHDIDVKQIAAYMSKSLSEE